jgi:hypothetical protein
MTSSGIGEKIRPLDSARMCARCAVWLLCFAPACYTQAMQAPGNPPVTSAVRPAAKAAHPSNTRSATARKPATAATNDKPAAAPLPSAAVARAATVSLKDGELTIDANNSELSQILRDVAAVSGMTIDGLGKSARVFGAYGPGNPRDVLTELLAGSGYNFMMAGDTPGGAPRELLLAAQNDNAPPLAAAGRGAAPPAPDNSDVDVSDELGPGAIAHVSPDERQNPKDSNAEEENNRVQNNMQRLQQIHSAQEQQNAPQ